MPFIRKKLDILSTPKPLQLLTLDMVLMSCSGVCSENLNMVLTFSKFSLTNAFGLFLILLLTCSPMLQKHLFIEFAMPLGLVLIT